MADEHQAICCSRCHRARSGGEVSVEEGFGFKKPGDRHQVCRRCRATRPEQGRAYYAQNREALQARSNAYKQAHREELSAKAREKVACELCGRMASHSNLKRHQASHLCEKNRPALEQAP